MSPIQTAMAQNLVESQKSRAEQTTSGVGCVKNIGVTTGIFRPDGECIKAQSTLVNHSTKTVEFKQFVNWKNTTVNNKITTKLKNIW